MVDSLVTKKSYDGTLLVASVNNEHGFYRKVSNTRKITGLGVNSTENTKEETNAHETKTELNNGVFFGRTSEAVQGGGVGENIGRTLGTYGKFGKFGRQRQRNRSRDGGNQKHDGVRNREKNDGTFKTRYKERGNIYNFFRSAVPTQHTGVRGLYSTDGVHNTLGSFATAHNTSVATKLPGSDVESETMASVESTESLENSSGFDNVCGKFGNGRKHLAEMEGTDKCTTSSDGDNYRSIARETFTQFLGSSSRYISDICIPENYEEIVQFLADVRQLSGPFIAGQLRIVSVHDTHIHVVHTCAYSNSTCRCTWLNGVGIWRTRRQPRHRRRVFAADITVTEWENIFRYFTTNGHAIQDVEGRGPNARLCLRLKNLQVKIKNTLIEIILF